jgi:hypothetical protein
VELAIETAEAVAGEEAAPRLADECRSDEAGRLVRREAEEDLLDELRHVPDILLPWRRRHGKWRFHVFLSGRLRGANEE